MGILSLANARDESIDNNRDEVNLYNISPFKFFMYCKAKSVLKQ
jgi:hypothetical protein